MAAPGPVIVSGLVEGALDEAVLVRLVTEAGALPGPVLGKTGKDYVLGQLHRYNEAARWSPWLVLVDLDQDAACAPSFREAQLPDPAPYMCFRVVVRAVESWLMADRPGLADFLEVAVARIPRNPEKEADPKRRMVQLAKLSKRRETRDDMVLQAKGGARVGLRYTPRLISFARTAWQPEVAAKNADSLRRCRQRLKELVEGQS